MREGRRRHLAMRLLQMLIEVCLSIFCCFYCCCLLYDGFRAKPMREPRWATPEGLGVLDEARLLLWVINGAALVVTRAELDDQLPQ